MLLIVTMICTFIAIGQVLSFLVIRNIAVDWGKREPEPGLGPLRLPVKQVIVVDTADEMECCPTQAECVRRLLAMQAFYRKLFKDIPFNFLIGCDGTVYTGRGFHFQGEIFAPRTNFSENSLSSNAMAKLIDTSQLVAYDEVNGTLVEEPKREGRDTFVVAFIGDFSEQPPSPDMLRTFTDFLTKSASQDLIAGDYTFVTQKQLESLNNSADALTVALSSLPNFLEVKLSYNVYLRDQWLSNMTLRSRIVFDNSTNIKAPSDKVIVTFSDNSCFDLVPN